MHDDRAARLRRIVDLADDLQDMGGRVVSNGGEPNYASEKLGRALTLSVHAIAAIAYVDEDELVEIVRREYQREREVWSSVTCANCGWLRLRNCAGRAASR